MIFKNAIFDVDGTLLDSMGLWRKGIIEYARGKCGDRDIGDLFENEAMKMTLRRGIAYYKTLVDDDTPDDEIVKLIKKYVHDGYLAGQEVKKGVVRLLEGLRREGVKMYVLSATPQNMVSDGLKKAGLYSYFERIMSVDGKEHGKESPETFAEVLSEINCRADETVLFEDALYSVNAAKAAGLYTVGFRDKYNIHTLDELKAASDEYFDSMEEYCAYHGFPI